MTRLHNMLPFRRTLLGLALLSAAEVANAAQTYCSSENTGSDFSAVNWPYQSNGYCSDQCRSEYAFAVVQYRNCWCSNYIPASQADVSDCSEECPGYPSELCGSRDSGLYGYIALNIAPSGTAGASSSTPSSTTSTTAPTTTSSSSEEQNTSIVSSTEVRTVTQSISQTIRTTQTTQTVETPTSRTSTTSRPQTTTSAEPEPVTSVVVSVVGGQTVTQFVTSTPSIASNAGDNVAVHRTEGLSAGAVAGIVIGVVAGLAAIALAAFLLWRRKKNAEVAAAAGEGGSAAGGKKNMTRNVSVLSKAGLLSGGAHPSMGERDTDDAFAAHGSNSVRHSMLFGPGAEGVSPTSPLGSSHGDTASSRRLSKPMVYDQRLNPSALFSNSEANGSRISMQDTQDYSRPLGVTNPDPRPSFESRTSNFRA